MPRKLPTVGPDPYTPEWYALRRYDPDRIERPVVFGASEAAGCLNVSPYTSPLEIHLRKRCETADIADNTAMAVGRALEPVILNLYEAREGVKIKKTPALYFHPEYNFMAATPDAIVIGADGSWERAVDAKTTTFHRYDKFGQSEDKYGQEGSDQLPRDLLCQAQQQMAVCGVERADFPVLFDAQTLRIYRVELVAELVVAIAKAEQELAERIVNNDPPEPNWELPETAGLLRDMYGHVSNSSIELPSEYAMLWEQYKILRDKNKAIESEMVSIRNRILGAMGPHEIGAIGSTELRRCVIAESRVVQSDVDDLAKRLGEIKRKGYERLLERKRR